VFRKQDGQIQLGGQLLAETVRVFIVRQAAIWAVPNQRRAEHVSIVQKECILGGQQQVEVPHVTMEHAAVIRVMPDNTSCESYSKRKGRTRYPEASQSTLRPSLRLLPKQFIEKFLDQDLEVTTWKL
jgi:hypothetical protein